MRNLKRALSLALAAIMLLGMMVVGASAVSYNDFSDRTEIVNKDAVSMLTTLGVIDGKPDGSYAPEEFVTREQMAKMISVIMNQGSDNNDLFVGVPSGLTDVAGNWALGHINYCYSLGIIAGRGDGRFDPTANVTASEAAKMLLVAAGYNPSSEGFVGADWAVNVNAKASALGIFRNYTKSTMADLNRDDAALLIYNALDVEMIQKYEDGYAIAFQDHRTILAAMYGVYKVEGVVVANKWAQLQQTNSAAALREGRTTLDNVIVYSSTTANTTTGENVRYTDPVSFNVDTTVDMLGKTVTLFIEKTTILADSKVLGVSIKDDVNVIHSAFATSKDIETYLKGTGVADDRTTQHYVNYGYMSAAEAIAWINNYEKDASGTSFNLNGISVEVIDNDNDGVAEYVLYLQETFSKVQRYNDKAETVTFYEPDRYTTGNNTGKLDGTISAVTLDFEDVVFEEDVTTNDFILYIQYGGRTYMHLADYITGVMSRVDRDKNDELYVTIEGEEYRQSYILDAATTADVDLLRFHIADAADEIGFTTAYDFFFDSTGEYIIAARPAEETVPNFGLVLGSAWTQNALSKSGQVKILKADGTVSTYDINWNASDDALKGVGIDDLTPVQNSAAQLTTKLELYLGTRDVNQSEDVGYANLNAAAGSVITYTVDDDNVLTIRRILQGNVMANTTNANGEGLDIANNVNTSTTAGVGDNGDIVYMGVKDHDGKPTTQPNNNFQYTAKNGYKNGTGYITVNGRNETYEGNPNAAGGPSAAASVAVGYKFGTNGNITGTQADKVNRTDFDHTYAVDRNTLAFYYDNSNPNDVKYGVATGWQNMSTVEKVDVQVYPVLDKTTHRSYQASELAEVILFNCAPSNTSANYMLVLSRNALGKDLLELNVVFEDGTVKTVKIDDEGDFDKDDQNHYMKAWTYVENADGTYDIGTIGKAAGVADLLRVGTVDFDDLDGEYESDKKHTKVSDHGRGNYGVISEAISKKYCDTNKLPIYEDEETLTGYIALSGNVNVWDVTDVDSANDEVIMGEFKKDIDVYTVLVIENNAIRTAWIWEIPGSSGRPTQPNNPYVLLTDNYRFVFVNAEGLRTTELEDLLKAELASQGYIVEEITNNSRDILTAVVTRNGVKNTFYAGGFITPGETPSIGITGTPSNGEKITVAPTAVDVPAMSDEDFANNPTFPATNNVSGRKVTILRIALPIPAGTQMAIRQTNPALQTSTNDYGGVGDDLSAVYVNGEYVRVSGPWTVASLDAADKDSSGRLLMDVLVWDDGRPITLEVIGGTSLTKTMTTSANGTGGVATVTGGTTSYTVTIDTSYVDFE